MELIKDIILWAGIASAGCLLLGAIFTAIGSLIPGVDPFDILGKFFTKLGTAIRKVLKNIAKFGNGKK